MNPTPIPLTSIHEIGSTSEELKRQATAGAPEQALMATIQTAGKGRQGRQWATIPGNLHLSVLLRPTPPIHPGHWATLTAVALADALHPHAPNLHLKWPNDVLLDNAKLAGILIETGHDQTPWLIAGFGVNLAAAPATLGRPTASLQGRTTPPAFAPTLLQALNHRRHQYTSHGYHPIRTAWLERGPQPGTDLGPGRFLGLDEDGALLLQTETGPQRVVSAGP